MKQTVITIYVYSIVFKDDSYFRVKTNFGTINPTRRLQPLIYNASTENIKLCVLNCLLSYLE